jgi:hypothetical protein
VLQHDWNLVWVILRLPNKSQIELPGRIPYAERKEIVDQILKVWQPYFNANWDKRITLVCLSILSDYLSRSPEFKGSGTLSVAKQKELTNRKGKKDYYLFSEIKGVENISTNYAKRDILDMELDRPEVIKALILLKSEFEQHIHKFVDEDYIVAYADLDNLINQCKLNERQKHTLAMLLEGCTCRDVGDALGVEAKHIHRTLDQITKRLNKI